MSEIKNLDHEIFEAAQSLAGLVVRNLGQPPYNPSMLDLDLARLQALNENFFFISARVRMDEETPVTEAPGATLSETEEAPSPTAEPVKAASKKAAEKPAAKKAAEKPAAEAQPQEPAAPATPAPAKAQSPGDRLLEESPQMKLFTVPLEGDIPSIIEQVSAKFPLAKTHIMTAATGAVNHINYLGNEGGPVKGIHGPALVRAVIRRCGVPTPEGEGRSPLLVVPSRWPELLNMFTKVGGAMLTEAMFAKFAGKASAEMTAKAADHGAYDRLLAGILDPNAPAAPEAVSAEEF